MANISFEDAYAWTEPTKVGDDTFDIDEDLERQTTEIVFGQLRSKFDVNLWADEDATPDLVRTICAMYYVAFYYDRTYSTDDDLSAYAVLLRGLADANIAGLIGGSIELPDDPSAGVDAPVFYPNDASSALKPTHDDPSLGPAYFSMGSVF